MDRIMQLKPPRMPNYASYNMPAGKRQDGMNFELGKFSIVEFTMEEAEEYGELMKQTFIKHWSERRLQQWQDHQTKS